MSNKDWAKKKKEKFITVSQLIEYLQNIPDKDDTYVGRVGHFGNFHELDKADIHTNTAYITSTWSWRSGKRETIKVLDICSPDIGPDPN